ncbi:HAD-IIA family hydrolase [Actinotignum urinale]|uniref:HAD-IIA family hydrolase n=1 Tax=Actinotignum urinale TaxID=190146 RepID=A0AAW9HYR5_9ACTO|nr:HAD-IIA family hydrolase [Actinotignum urinale]MDY5129755.1 HAD-IIA family hydrolase [Actinotignum urinale]MDY5133790.1 HAD-IIA family hydrolase [Actinotignum urinale]MDY5151527.1 HAD-IIA family hydrolase [Actinotignum urinale]MDY5155605.1 HAD-IIA family hydrolase [Actinotignum urinale]MDY5161118.1 HAD-IIA family hydrolase [Actinotignum urinale]
MTRLITSWLSDMDGVLIHEEKALPGAKDFLDKLNEKEYPYLVLTNNSIFTRRDLSERLRAAGLEVPEEHIWTSAEATARFLADQVEERRAYVVGEAGLTTAMYNSGFVMTNVKPEVVVLGETRTYSIEALTQAIRLIENGARFIATNPDVTGPSEHGSIPATGAVAAMITAATGRKPYYVGKPNPVMLRRGLNLINSHSENTALVGDRMDTDVLSGMEAGLQTHLVLTGSTAREDIVKFPYRPDYVHPSIQEVAELI